MNERCRRIGFLFFRPNDIRKGVKIGYAKELLVHGDEQNYHRFHLSNFLLIVNQSADIFSLQHLQKISFFIHIKNINRKIIFFTKRKCRKIHDF